MSLDPRPRRPSCPSESLSRRSSLKQSAATLQPPQRRPRRAAASLLVLAALCLLLFGPEPDRAPPDAGAPASSPGDAEDSEVEANEDVRENVAEAPGVDGEPAIAGTFDPIVEAPRPPLRDPAPTLVPDPSARELAPRAADDGERKLQEFRPSTQGATGLSKDAVARIVHRHAAHVGQCRPRTEHQRPPLRLVVEFDVVGDGSLSNLAVRVTEGTDASDAVACVARAFSMLRFRPLDRGPLHISYPVNLG